LLQGGGGGGGKEAVPKGRLEMMQDLLPLSRPDLQVSTKRKKKGSGKKDPDKTSRRERRKKKKRMRGKERDERSAPLAADQVEKVQERGVEKLQ